MRPYPGKHLHLFTASRGDEYDFHPDRRPYSCRTFLTRSIWPQRRLTTWALILLGVAGLGTILVGLSPENVNVLFQLIGALNIPAGNAAMILLGLAIWRERIKLAWFSVLSGVIGLLGLVVGPVLVILTGHGGGLAERIALYPLIIWLIVFGFAILTTKVRTRDNPGPTPSGETAAQESEFAAKPR
jgi:hypothetical protein